MTYFRLYSLTGMALNTTESFGRLAFSFNLLSILEIVPHSSAGMPLTRTLAVSLFQPIENRSQAQSLPQKLEMEWRVLMKKRKIKVTHFSVNSSEPDCPNPDRKVFQIGRAHV